MASQTRSSRLISLQQNTPGDLAHPRKQALPLTSLRNFILKKKKNLKKISQMVAKSPRGKQESYKTCFVSDLIQTVIISSCSSVGEKAFLTGKKKKACVSLEPTFKRLPGRRRPEGEKGHLVQPPRRGDARRSER